jgi:hypothetical protein
VTDLNDPSRELSKIKGSEARVLLLYCNKAEAIKVFDSAHRLGFTSKDYIWIVSRNVIGNEKVTPSSSSLLAPSNFPQGMLGEVKSRHIIPSHHPLNRMRVL